MGRGCLELSHGRLLAVVRLRVVRVDIFCARVHVEAVLADVVDHRVLEEVLDALATHQSPPHCRGTDLVGNPLRDDVNVTP